MSSLILIIAVFMVLAGFTCSLRTSLTTTRAPQLPTVEPSSKPEPAVGKQTESHPVSLAALMEKDFNGRDFKVGRVLADNAIYTRYYITYLSGQLMISGIMNVPKAPPPVGGYPLLILNHGYIDPVVYTNGRGLRREQDYLVRQGFVVVHPDYRNHAESDDDENVELNFRLGYTEDVINVILAIRRAKLPYINGEKVGMLGHSMGGGITQNVLVVKPDLVKAAVLYASVSGDYKDNYQRYTIRRPETMAKITAAYGDIINQTDFWSNLSAVTYYQRLTAPVEIHIGTNDQDVEPEWSYTIHNKLTTLGKQVSLYEYEGERHEFSHGWPLMMQRITAFFTTQLKAGQPITETQ